MKKKFLLFAGSFFALLFLAIPANDVFAAKTPTPRITEIAGIHTPNIRVHFQIKPVKAGEIIKVKYKLSPKKLGDVEYKIPKKAKKSGTVKAAASETGSAIDLRNLPFGPGKFIYNVKVQVKVPGKSWSSWSNTYSM